MTRTRPRQCKSCLKTIETNKAEFKDATEDKARIVALSSPLMSSMSSWMARMRVAPPYGLAKANVAVEAGLSRNLGHLATSPNEKSDEPPLEVR